MMNGKLGFPSVPSGKSWDHLESTYDTTNWCLCFLPEWPRALPGRNDGAATTQPFMA